jgi:hypothetical protein
VPYTDPADGADRADDLVGSLPGAQGITTRVCHGKPLHGAGEAFVDDDFIEWLTAGFGAAWIILLRSRMADDYRVRDPELVRHI